MTRFIFFTVSTLFFTTPIYNFTIKSIDNVNIPLSGFQGKKILLVNTATNSPYVNQYAGLDSLWQLYKDSLVIIALPSNSFGHEFNSNAAIKAFVNNTYHPHYILGAKVDVRGENKAPLYRWLALPTENGVMNGRVRGDFYKFLINRSGILIGAFDGSVRPMSAAIQDAIKN